MRILVIHPGASWSIYDVYKGIWDWWEKMGVELVKFDLEGRMNYAGGWLHYLWRATGKQTDSPEVEDIVYFASSQALERALRFQVDWVFVVCGMHFHPDITAFMKMCGLKVAYLFTESPYDDQWQIRVAPWTTACWVNERSSVAKFREVQPHTYYYQHAFDPERHRPGSDPTEGGASPIEVATHDVVFVGTGFIERIDLLRGVNWDGIDFGLYGAWGLLGSRNRLRKYLRGDTIPNEETAALYHEAKIGLNIHRTSIGFGRETVKYEGAESLNPRAYELSACGLFHISDNRAELEDIFGGLVPTFETAEELEALVRRYLPDEKARRDISAQLPAAVAGHTFERRATEILEILKSIN